MNKRFSFQEKNIDVFNKKEKPQSSNVRGNSQKLQRDINSKQVIEENEKLKKMNKNYVSV